MTLQLRDYQTNANKKLAKAIGVGKKTVLYSLPTGAGKTVCMADFAIKSSKIGYKTLIVVDRVELLKQTARWGTSQVPFGVLSPNIFRPENVTVAMLQTLRSRLKSENYQKWLEQFNVIYCDEIHQYASGASLQKIKDLSSDDCVLVGVTATPWCMKGYLLEGFEEFILGTDIRELIEQGYLARPRHLTIDLFDFSKVKVTSTGDYDSGAIDDIVVDTEKVDKVFSLWAEHARSKKTLAFCSTVKSAEHYARFFRMNGVRAKAVSAEISEAERERTLIDYKNGDIEVLFNVGLYVAGFDEPSIECIMSLNPTKILRRHIQCLGRGLRLCPEIGKTECLFIDFVGNSFRHLEVDAIQSYVHAPEKASQEEFDQIECPACGTVFDIAENECPECGYILKVQDDGGSGGGTAKAKKDFERLIKLKSVQRELHDLVHEFVGLPCIIRTEPTGKMVSGRPEKKWCYGLREDGSPIFKTDKDYSSVRYPYPLTTTAKKANCWYVFHTICTKYDPKLGALRYYGKKLRKAKAFLSQLKDPYNRAFVNLYNLMS